jgi:hypothetical protein
MESPLLVGAEQRVPAGCHPGPLDVFVLVKQWMADNVLSQPALLMLPQAFMPSVDRFIESASRAAGTLFPAPCFQLNRIVCCMQ